jgi:hypothetical protein
MADAYSRADIKSRVTVQVRDDKGKKSYAFSIHNIDVEKVYDELFAAAKKIK